MKVFNTYYENDDRLKSYIQQHKISESQNILIQVFTGIVERDYIEQLISSLRRILPQAKILGATTSGEILEDSVSDHQTVLSFSLFEKTALVTYHTDGGDGVQVANNMIKQIQKHQDLKLFITFADGLSVNGEAYIKVFERFNENLVIAGGLSGDNSAFKRTFIFTEKGCYDGGAVGAVLCNPHLIVHSEYNYGWESIGKHLTITKAKDNVAYAIDGIPAKDIYVKYLGKEVADMLPATGIEFPLVIKRNNINIARAILGVNEDGSLVFAGNVNEGDIVQFGYGNIDAILSSKRKRYENLNHKPIEAFFVYSCMARKQLLGDAISSEIIPLSRVAPVSGFFTYGELYHDAKENKNELLNETMTVISLSENVHTAKEIFEKMEPRDIHLAYTIKALSNLVSVTSLELQELNRTLEEKVEAQVNVIEEKQSQLIQQSRHAVMGEMIGMIAHQWRQPLAAIAGNVGSLTIDMMMDNYEKKPFQKHIDQIGEQAKFLSTTIDDFRNFFKEDKEKTREPLKDIVEDALQIIDASIKNQKIMLKKHFKADANILTYPNELKQVVLNLIKNAEDVLLEKNISEPTIWVKTLYKSDCICLEISDNAGGIPLGLKKKIFEPYFTTKAKRDGTGLGLYMSKVIIEEHCNGKIDVNNDEQGAVFKIELKIDDDMICILDRETLMPKVPDPA